MNKSEYFGVLLESSRNSSTHTATATAPEAGSLITQHLRRDRPRNSGARKTCGPARQSTDWFVPQIGHLILSSKIDWFDGRFT